MFPVTKCVITAMSQVEPDTTSASFVGTIFPILSLNLVSQAYYSNTLAG